MIGAGQSDDRAKPDLRSGSGGVSGVGWLLTIGAVAALIAHLVDPKLKIDSITIALIVVAALPWLGEILESFDLPGGGGVRYRDRIEKLEKKTARVEQETTRVFEQVDNAVESGQDARGEFSRSDDLQLAEMPGSVHPLSSETNLRALAQQYNDIRATQQPGFERTSAMTAVAREMMEASKTTDDFEWRSALASLDRGVRLAAYAYLSTRPQPDSAEALSETLLHHEDKPFGQYWALKALRAVAEVDDKVANFRPELEEFLRTLNPGTDRARELAKVIKRIDGTVPRPDPRGG